MSFNIHTIASQQGRVAIVTGANDGLGFQTTLALSKTGMKVVMACRNTDKGNKARMAILKEVPDANLELMPLDLSKLDDVRMFADDYLKTHDRLDLLINNAGIMIPPFELTQDGFESQFGVNYLSHFLLTRLLLPLLEKTEGSRVVSLSSNAHKNGKIHFDDLQFKKKYSAIAAYSQSKLACLMFAYELQRRLYASGSKVLSVAAHPGMSDTNLFKHVPRWVNSIFGGLIRGMMAQSAEDGVQPTLYAALGNDIQGGDYTGPDGWQEWKGKPVKVKGTKLAQDKNVAKKLWQESEKLTSNN